MPLAHVAGIPVEEMAPVLATGGPLVLAGLYRGLSTWLSRLRQKGDPSTENAPAGSGGGSVVATGGEG